MPTPASGSNQPQHGASRICPACSAIVPREFAFCGGCGTQLAVVEVSSFEVFGATPFEEMELLRPPSPSVSAFQPIMENPPPTSAPDKKTTDIRFATLPLIRSPAGRRAKDDPKAPRDHLVPLADGKRLLLRGVGNQIEGMLNRLAARFHQAQQSRDRVGRADWGQMIRVVRDLGGGAAVVVEVSLERRGDDALLRVSGYSLKGIGILRVIWLVIAIPLIFLAALGGHTNDIPSARKNLNNNQLREAEGFFYEINSLMLKSLEEHGISALDQMNV